MIQLLTIANHARIHLGVARRVVTTFLFAFLGLIAVALWNGINHADAFDLSYPIAVVVASLYVIARLYSDSRWTAVQTDPDGAEHIIYVAHPAITEVALVLLLIFLPSLA